MFSATNPIGLRLVPTAEHVHILSHKVFSEFKEPVYLKDCFMGYGNTACGGLAAQDLRMSGEPLQVL